MAAMATVETVTGPVGAGSLGQTLMHEHLFILYPELRLQDKSWDDEARVADAAAKLAEAHALGIDTVVDLSVYGMGRDFERSARVAERSGVNVIGATGIYFFNELPTYFTARTANESPTFIEDLLVREIEIGAFDTGIRAGIIKCITDVAGVTPDADLALRSSARAQRRTGVPITTHTHAASEGGIEQQRIFREEGVDLGRVVIGHSGDTTDLDYLERLIDAGSYVGMDRFGSYRFRTFEERVQTVARLCERGYANRVVLSHDTNCYSDGVRPEVRATLASYKDMRFTHISEDVLPALRQAGVGDADIQQMMVVNPREIFSQRG